ncbi:hypothetical protein C8R46DRAFT_1211537 [Mycena filopes]|nr:hypothetical protein C8R46DRAFT_1211537 [Mycena filopes]
MALPPPRIYVEDWSSLGLNMTELFETTSSTSPRSGVGALSDSGADPFSTPRPELAAVEEEEEEELSEYSADTSLRTLDSTVLQSSDLEIVLAVAPAELQEAPHPNDEAEASVSLDKDPPVEIVVPESAVLPFSAGHYASNAMSAVSGLLWDPPAVPISHSTPLPAVAPPPSPSSEHRPQSTTTTFLTVTRDSLVPYPDLFDFSMYDRRVSQDSSFRQSSELSLTSSPEAADKKWPVSIYDVVLERDRYRGAAYSACISSSVTRTSSSPRRKPLTSTLNLGRDTVDFETVVSKKSEIEVGEVGAQFLLACDELSRCEWTEEEFMTLFASSVTV